jgi:endonuclease/exonuclease/phosphatase family metal-dependent hydrolase
MRVVTWNVNGRLASSRAREVIAHILASVDADVLCLQEVNRRSQARWLAGALGLRFRDAWWHNGGVAILCRRSPNRALVKSIPGSYYGGFVAVETQGVWVAAVHLDSRRYLHSERRRLSETAFLLNQFASASIPVVLAGDWNSVAHVDLPVDEGSGCKRIRDTARLPSRLLQAAGWRDSHQSSRHARTTWMPALDQPAHCSLERIDRIYVAGPARITRQQTLGPAQVAHMFPAKTPRWPTGRDHLIVAADIHLATQPLPHRHFSSL